MQFINYPSNPQLEKPGPTSLALPICLSRPYSGALHIRHVSMVEGLAGNLQNLHLRNGPAVLWSLSVLGNMVPVLVLCML